MDYHDFLQRQQALFIGHTGPMTDADFIALAVYELKQLLHINSLEIRLADDYWSISTDEDWIANLVGEDTPHYFNGLVTHPSIPNATLVLGGMLGLHAAKVATFKNGVCDWHRGEQIFLSAEFRENVVHKSRVLLFKVG